MSIGMWDKYKRKKDTVKPKFTSKELYYMITKEQRETLPILRIQYRGEYGSISETCGLLRVKEIKKITKKVFSIRYNRKELLRLLSSTTNEAISKK